MDLNCLNGIITDNLAIHIDLTDENSWDLNTGYTSVSLNKWKNAVSDNLDLYDFGLTEYDNGRIDRMWSGATFTPEDTKVTLYRVGYNQCVTPYSGETMYDGYPLSAITTEDVGNYFVLSGGYLQGFFKLHKYNFEQFPPRYNNGITIETIIKIDADSKGTFYHMGLRAEDKYNDYFSGETKKTEQTRYRMVRNNVVGTKIVKESITGWSGVSTSEENYLHAYLEEEVLKDAISSFDDDEEYEQKWTKVDQSANTQNNIISFGLTDDKRIFYKLINGDNLIGYNTSKNQITSTGWTIIDIVFTPDAPIPNYDPNKHACYDRRKGTLSFYVNGRLFWDEKAFDEFYFRGMSNDKEKQIGVPYSISWGGGTFGLKHSCHYNTKVTDLYTDEDTNYINDNFISKIYPFNDNPRTGSTVGGVAFTSDDYTFVDSEGSPEIVFRVDYTGTTAQTPSNQYYFEHIEPFEVLSNRDYKISLRIYDTGIFQAYDSNDNRTQNSIRLVVYGSEDINIISERSYESPLRESEMDQDAPFDINGEYEYYDPISGLMIDGETGYPSFSEANQEQLEEYERDRTVTGTDQWHEINLKFQMKENSGQEIVYIGVLLESTVSLVEDFVFFMDDWNNVGSDALAKDPAKENLLIEQNFNDSFNGGIQKLRLYDVAFNSQQVLHNALIEANGNSAYNLTIQKGGRIIYR